MDRLHAMEVFVAVAEEEGFNAAARRLRMSAPSVTRAVASLEAHLGVRLLERTTRHVRTTESGAHYLEDARRLLSQLTAIEEATAGIHGSPKGHIGVTAPVLFGRMFITPTIVEYLQAHPETEVSAYFLDRVVNLVDEGLEVGVRIGQLPDSSLRALRVGAVRHLLCASPTYLQKHGTPGKPSELKQHPLISSSAGGFSHEWQFEGAAQVRLRPRLITTTNDAAIEAACLGFGIVRCLSYQVAANIESGELVGLLDEFGPEPMPVHIVHREGQYETIRVRAFIDMLAKKLRADKRINQVADI